MKLYLLALVIVSSYTTSVTENEDIEEEWLVLSDERMSEEEETTSTDIPDAIAEEPTATSSITTTSVPIEYLDEIEDATTFLGHKVDQELMIGGKEWIGGILLLAIFVYLYTNRGGDV
jgi:hypothetical protein